MQENCCQHHRIFQTTWLSMPYGISYNLSIPVNTCLPSISADACFTERWRKEAKLSRSQWLVWRALPVRVVKKNYALVKIKAFPFLEVRAFTLSVTSQGNSVALDHLSLPTTIPVPTKVPGTRAQGCLAPQLGHWDRPQL